MANHYCFNDYIPGTLAIQRRCDWQTLKASRISAGLLASITVTLLTECVLVHIHTKEENCCLSFSSLCLSPSYNKTIWLTKATITQSSLNMST